jgi:DNA-binding FrmR family transcriptional regulator
VSITVFDRKHVPIRTFSTRSKETDTKLECQDGINTFVWDMLYPPAVKVPGMLLWTGGPGTPMGAPGEYSVRIRYGHDSAEVPFRIKADPNYLMSDAEYDAQIGFLLQVRDKYNEVQRAVLQVRSIRGQLQALNGRLDSSDAPVRRLSDSIIHQLTAVEEALYQTKSKSDEDMLNYPIRINDKLSGLYGIAAGGYAVPTSQAREVFAELSAKADVQLDRLKSIVSDQLSALNKLVYERQVPIINTKVEEEGGK